VEQEICVVVVINRAKTARAACNMSVQAIGGVLRCSYCDSSAPFNCGLVVVVLQVTGGVKLNSGSQMFEKMGETVEFMA